MKSNNQSKTNRALISIAVIGIGVYLGFTPLYNLIQGGVAGAVIGASFGAIFVVILTNYLLSKQTEIEQESKRSERVFDEKITLYKAILLETERMLEDGKIQSHEELKKIPFLMLRLQMVGNDEAIQSFQKVYKEINSIFAAEPDKDEVEIPTEASFKILEHLGEFSNVCRLDLGVSDDPISLTLFDEISEDIRQSNTIATGKEVPTEGTIVIHDKIIKLKKDLEFKTVNRNWLAWQCSHWPSRVEFQVVIQPRKKHIFVQFGAENKSGKYVADQMHDLLPIFKSKIPEVDWDIDGWYSEYDNRIFATFDLNDTSKVAEVFVKLINEVQEDVEVAVKQSS